MTEIAEAVHCPNCGAPLELQPGEVVITCSFCGAASNMAGGSQFFLKHSLIPSNYDREKAMQLVRAWMSGGFLKPDDMGSASKVDSMELSFLPFYVMHIKASTDYEGVFTRTGGNIPRKGRLEKEYYWKVLGRRASAFPAKEYDIPLKGKVNFDLSHIPKDGRYLNAEMDEGEAASTMRTEVEVHHKFLLGEEIDVIQRMETSIEELDTEFVHAPVWFVKYTYHCRAYDMTIDGCTGKTIKADIPPPDTSNKGFLKSMKKGIFGR